MISKKKHREQHEDKIASIFCQKKSIPHRGDAFTIDGYVISVQNIPQKVKKRTLYSEKND